MRQHSPSSSIQQHQPSNFVSYKAMLLLCVGLLALIGVGCHARNLRPPAPEETGSRPANTGGLPAYDQNARRGTQSFKQEAMRSGTRPSKSLAPAPTSRGPMTRSGRHTYKRRPMHHNPYRPGLGTRYGESHYAPAHYTVFHRSSSAPSARFRFDYNDGRGIYTMAQRFGRHCCHSLSPRNYGRLRISITDRVGRPLRGVLLPDRSLLQGRHNQRYQIQVYNPTPYRYEVVASVDGLDVIDGQRAALHKRGYIIQPYRTLRIKGFRRSHRYVAAFRFSSVSNSYASRMGRGRNIGVIGVAIFGESRPAWDAESRRRMQAQPFAPAP